MATNPLGPVILSELGPEFDPGTTVPNKVSIKVSPTSPVPLTRTPSGLSVGPVPASQIPDFWRDGTGAVPNGVADTTELITRVGDVVIGPDTQAIPAKLRVHSPDRSVPALMTSGLVRYVSYGNGLVESGDVSRAFSGFVAGIATDGTIVEVPSSNGALSGQTASYVGPLRAGTDTPEVRLENFRIRIGGVAGVRNMQVAAVAGTEQAEIYRTNLWGGGAVEAQNFNALSLTTTWQTIDGLILEDSDRVGFMISPTSATDPRWIECLVWIASPQKACLSMRRI